MSTSLKISSRRIRTASGWGSWGTSASPVDVDANSKKYLALKAVVPSGKKLTKLTVNVGFSTGASNSATADLYCRVYTADPTGLTYMPSSDYSTVSTKQSLGYTVKNFVFSFSGLSITSGNSVYVMFCSQHYNTSDPEVVVSAETLLADYEDYSFTGITLSSDSVSTGDKLTVTAQNGSGISITATVKYGSTTIATYSPFTTGQVVLYPTKSWFDTAGVTTSTSITLAVELTGGGVTKTASFTLKAGSDMYPTVSNLALELKQPSNAEKFTDWIANISYAKISATVTANTESDIKEVTVSFPGGTTAKAKLNSSTGLYEAYTEAPITGNTTFTVKATDKRSLSGSDSISLTGVVPYTLPSVKIDDIYRCDSNGDKLDGGDYYRLKVTASYYAELSGNSVKKLTSRVQNREEFDITSGVYNVVSGTTDATKAYTIVIAIQDQISDEITRKVILDGELRNVVIKRSDEGTYVGIGTTPETTSGKSTVELPLGGRFMYGGMEAGTIIHAAEAFDGSSFDKDVLNVDFEQRDSPLNQSAFFERFADDIKNLPDEIANETSWVWHAYREVFWFSTDRITVRLTELEANYHRVWHNFWDGKEWYGWHLEGYTKT
jgi:hypothetical protein